MIDFTVARDKLSQFQTTEELAAFLRSEGVVGHREQAASCVLAKWMQVQTGELVYVSTDDMWINPGSEALHNVVLEEFITQFDLGEYPELEC